MRSRRHGDTGKLHVDSVDRAWRRRQDFEIERQLFVRQQIDLVRTFLEIAEQSRDAAVRTRNLVHALHAYDSILALLRGSGITPAGRAHMEPELRRLKERIDQL